MSAQENEVSKRPVGNAATGFLAEVKVEEKVTLQIPNRADSKNKSDMRDIVITRVFDKDGVVDGIKFNSKTVVWQNDLEYLAQNFSQVIGRPIPVNKG